MNVFFSMDCIEKVIVHIIVAISQHFIPLLKKACTYVYMGYVERLGDNTAKLKIFFWGMIKRQQWLPDRMDMVQSIVPYIY